jgi:PAS domain S-box-containing protein
MVGYTREEMEAGEINWILLTPMEYAQLDEKALETVIATGACAPYEKDFVRKDGSRVPIMIGAATFENNREEGVCFILDLTESKKIERNALRNQRMESIGTLAGGIAHDLNNTLTPIIMALELLKSQFKDRASQELLAVLNSSAQRGADMVRQVLSFARGVEGRRMEVQVKHLLREIEKIVNDTFLKNIELRTIFPAKLWTVIGDPTQLHQVLLNLCVNARDAMPKGGILMLSAENLTLDSHYAGLTLSGEAAAGPYVLIEVKDTGTGMPADVLEKIFDPFFTTKELGKGTGLGLSTSLAILKSHKAFLQVQSELGKGTTFSVYIPAEINSSLKVQELACEHPRGHGELILVVDDEPAVRQITQQTLELFGYRAILACDGVEAVGLYALHGAEIAVVLTDIMMPVMDGPTMIQVLLKMNPKLLIIGASGFASDRHAFASTSAGVKQFLAKPYTAETLLVALQQVLALPTVASES